MIPQPAWTQIKSNANAVSQVPRATFAKAVTYDSGGYGTMSLAVADLNRDGHLDAVMANQCADTNCASGSIGVLLGNGDRTFRAPVTYRTGGAYFVVIADVNGDQYPDLVVTNDDSVSILLGNGDGTFQSAVSYSSGGYVARTAAVADVNGDGHPDIVASNSNYNIGVLLGNGDGTFQSPAIYPSAGYSVAIGDLSGDGHLDLVAGQAYYSVTELLGNGDGTFQTPRSYGSGGWGATSLAIGDVNGDGKPDLITALQSLQSNQGGVGVMLGNGDGTFQPVVGYPSARFARSVAIGDVNGDGHPDLIAGNLEVVSVLLGRGDGTFQSSGNMSVGGDDGGPAAIADVNEDVRPDLLVADFALDLSSSPSNRRGALSVLLNLTQRASTLILAASDNPALVNQPLKLTATITSRVTIPDGTSVTFFDGSTEIGSSTTTAGVATLNTLFPAARTHTIRAHYAGSPFTGAVWGWVTEVVNRHSTSTTLLSNLNPSNFGQAVTFTAQVAGTASNTLSGKVMFWDGATAIGTVSLSEGAASLTKSHLAVGTHTITAQYLGDAADSKSISSSLDQRVEQK
jgi:Bacterial Ig-like domain (group 3)/FG-GAP-like repeat/FG-GAP repeat